jgi:hypothetical protein
MRYCAIPTHSALYDGFVSGLSAVRTITREQLVIIKKSVADAIPSASNWENVWGKMLNLIHVDFFWNNIVCLQKLAVSLGVAPAPLTTPIGAGLPTLASFEGE